MVRLVLMLDILSASARSSALDHATHRWAYRTTPHAAPQSGVAPMRTIPWATVFDSLDLTCRIARADGQLEHVPPELNSEGFPGRSGWQILSALICFWERERCRRPTLLIFEVE